MAPRRASDRIRHRDPSATIFVAAEQETPSASAAEGVLSCAQQQLLSREMHTATPVKPKLMDIQAAIIGRNQP